jgi:hypothetical protein
MSCRSELAVSAVASFVPVSVEPDSTEKSPPSTDPQISRSGFLKQTTLGEESRV